MKTKIKYQIHEKYAMKKIEANYYINKLIDI